MRFVVCLGIAAALAFLGYQSVAHEDSAPVASSAASTTSSQDGKQHFPYD